MRESLGTILRGTAILLLVGATATVSLANHNKGCLPKSIEETIGGMKTMVSCGQMTPTPVGTVWACYGGCEVETGSGWASCTCTPTNENNNCNCVGRLPGGEQ